MSKSQEQHTDAGKLNRESIKSPQCTNYSTCQLVHTDSVVSDPATKHCYIQSYCTKDESTWKNCKRYITSGILNFCPDFVLPDSPLSPAEILDEFDTSLNEDNH